MSEGRKRSFRDLDVWSKACDLVVEVYRATDDFPGAETYGVKAHMRKTVWSIPLNIAEGCARHGNAEMLQFLNVAAGSLAEMETFLEITPRLSYLRPEQAAALGSTAAEVGRMLHGLISSVRSRPNRR